MIDARMEIMLTLGLAEIERRLTERLERRLRQIARLKRGQQQGVTTLNR